MAPQTSSTSVIFRSPRVFLFLGLLFLQGGASAVPLKFLPWDDAVAARKMALQDASGVKELTELHPGKRSKAFEGKAGEAPLQLVALDRKTPDGKAVSVDIKLAADMKSPLVLIVPDPKHATGLRTFVIEDNAGAFAWGTMRMINATGKVLMIRVDKSISPLPNSWNPVDVKPGGDARNVSVQVAAKDNPKAILYSAVWEHDPNLRKLAFILPGSDDRTGAIEFKIIPEDKRVAAQPAPAARP